MELIGLITIAIFLALVYMGIGIIIRTLLQKTGEPSFSHEGTNMAIIIGWPFVIMCIIVATILWLLSKVYYWIRKKRWQNR